VTESNQTYSCLVESTLEAIKALDSNVNLTPKYVMADFSSAIHKALSNSVPQSTLLHCRFHFWNLINTKLKTKKWFEVCDLSSSTIPSKFLDYFNLKLHSRKSKKYDPRRIIRYDIAILCKLPSEAFFNRYFKIITPFWMKYAKKFFKMFKEDYIQNYAKNGWANFRSGTVPKTNNNMEGYNRAIKQTVTNRQSRSFSDFFQLMKDELISKSEEASKIMRFPKIPYYNEDFICLVNLLSKNFDRLFVEFDGSYFIIDPSIACTFHQKKRVYFLFSKAEFYKDFK